jgi:integrase
VLSSYAKEHAHETADPKRIGFAMKQLLAWWGESTVDAILPESCKKYRKERNRQGAKDGTVRKELGTLRAAVNHDFKEARLLNPPAVWLPPRPPGRDKWITREEAARLLWEARKTHRSRLHLPLFILIALSTGARKGAILDLQWSQIDLVAGRIDFNPVGRQRTAKGRPVIPIPRGLHWFLKRAHARATSPYVIAYDGHRTSKDGKPHRVGDIKKSFRSAAKAAKLPGITPHTLRHTAGTWMAQRGVPLREIAGWLGHSDAKTTELYAHHHPDFMAAAKRAMD